MGVSLSRILTRGRVRLAVFTATGTLCAIVVAVAINALAFRHMGADAVIRSFMAAGAMAIALAGPLFFLLFRAWQRLADANQKLTLSVSVDSLTHCLNRDAFAASMEGWLNKRADLGEPVTGALLVVEADYFKRINEQFGHHEGDVALKLMAAAIRSVLRSGDRSGRLGSDRFGVFLPNVRKHNALKVADRIRKAIQDLSFEPDGDRCSLSVSIGCAAFEERMRFTDISRMAHEHLDAVRNAAKSYRVLTPADDGKRIMLPHAGTLH